LQRTPQAPFAQTAAPFGGDGQALLHAPQCFKFVRVSRHWPAQAERPGLHSTAQLAALQAGRPLTGVGQLVAQSPQWAGSAPRSTQLFSQGAVPAGQLATHLPREQTWFS
jgi:hypothetical protein